jgi:Tripartite ATP-independent periplasmic transporters, DctQ component.
MPSLNLLYDNVKGRWQYLLYAVTRLLLFYFVIIGIKSGYQAILNNLNYVSPVLGIPGVLIYSSPFVACLLMLFECVIEVLGVAIGELAPFEGRSYAKLWQKFKERNK